MDTKLKSYNGRKKRWILFLLAVICIGSAAAQLESIRQEDYNIECLSQKEYHKSNEFYASYVEEAMLEVSNIAYNLIEIEDAPYYYYIFGGSKEHTNIGHNDREFYSSYDRAFFYLDKREWKAGSDSYQDLDIYNMLSRNYIAYIAFPNEFLDQKQEEWDGMRGRILPEYLRLMFFILGGLALSLSLCITTWKETSGKEAELKGLDKAKTEIHLILLLLVAGLFNFLCSDLIGKSVSVGMNMSLLGLDYLEIVTPNDFSMVLLVGGVAVFTSALLLTVILSMLRKGKAKRLGKDSILFQLGGRILRLMKEILHYIIYYDASSHAPFTKRLYYRQMIFLMLTFVDTGFIVLFMLFRQVWFLIPLALELFAMLWYFKGNQWILRNINEEIQEKMEERMKSERMKVALVTNVSHDLKTPLTSIISFIDLLAMEEGLSETAQDYVKILQQKSERLKNIVNDLFDLAKSTSGDTIVEYEHLDLVKLIRQTLADMDDRIVASQLPVKLMLPDTPVSIYADGKKLYRVFQNVLDNAIKYALRGTRVIIEIQLLEERAIVYIKNIAGYEMNFTAQEILQRFARGDQSRSTEGSGLGLSIAESFTKVCGGEFDIEIDGDMFKTRISFARVQKSKVDSEENTLSNE